jgi:hypothetical protein
MGSSAYQRYLIAVIVLLLGLLIVSFTLPNAGRGKVDPLGSAGMNIAKNPSFEEGEESRQGWKPVIWRGSASFLWIDLSKTGLAGDVRTGDRSLMIQSSSSNTLCAWESKEPIDVKPGFIYDVHVWTKIEEVESEGVHIGIAWFDQEGKWIGVSSSENLTDRTEDWKEISVTAKAPQNATKGSIELHLNGKGIVFFDDVFLEESMPSDFVFNGWSITRGNLRHSSVAIQNNTLTIQARFESSADEFIVCQRGLDIDTLRQPYLTLNWRTSTNRPGDPGIFLDFVTASGRTFIQPLGFSENWTTSTVNLNVFTKGEEVTAVKFTLNDWDDSVSSGLFSIQIREVYFSSVLDLKNNSLLLVSFGTLALAIIDSYKRANKLNKVILVVATVALMSALPSFVLPFYKLPSGEVITIITILIVLGLTSLKFRIENKESTQTESSRTTNFIALLVGVLIIPWLAFLLWLNYANLPTLFSDETSYGIMSWGILNGKLVGLHFPGPWVANIPDSFKIEGYPFGLPLPYTIDWMTNLNIVSPFLLPFLCPLISAPVIAFLGFSGVTIRLAYVLMSTISVAFTFLIGRHFSNRIGLIGAGFMAFIPLSVNFGSRAFMDNGVLLFLLVTVFLYLRFKQTGKRAYLYLAAVTAGLCTLTKFGFGFLALGFLILALFFDSKKRREIIKVLPISLGIFSMMIIGYLLINYQGLIWSLSYYVKYVPLLAIQGQAWMTQPLLILTYPELVLGLICLLYVLRDKGDFGKLLLLLLLTSIPLIILAKPMWLMPIVPLLGLGVGKAMSNGRNKRDIVLKSVFLLIFAYVSAKDFPMISELFIGFFALILVFAIISQFVTLTKFGFLKNDRLFDALWVSLICIVFTALYVQSMLFMPLS